MTDALLELAAKCEAGAGPSRKLDAEIRKMLRLKGNPAGRGYRPYTASIDGALTLVPEGCWAEGAFGAGRGTSAIEIHAPMTFDPLGAAVAATPALALTAASLRALAQKGTDDA